MPATGLGQAAGSLARVYRGMIQIGFAYSQMQGRGAFAWLGRAGRGGGRAESEHSNISVANESPGSQTGRQQPQIQDRIRLLQPLPGRPNGTSGDTWRHPAALRKCLLSSRSRVRVAVGAHTRNPRSASFLLMFGRVVMVPTAAAVPVACPMASPWTGPAAPLPACSARPRWPAAAHRRHAGTRSRPGSWSAPSAPSALEGSRPRPRACCRYGAGRENASPVARLPPGQVPRTAPEVGMPQRPAARAGEDEPVITRPGVGLDVCGQVRRDQLGIATMRTPASDFGGPNEKPPPSRSFSCLITRTVRAWASMSERRSAASSPHRRLVKAASSTRTR